jgi:hypothetical protein
MIPRMRVSLGEMVCEDVRMSRRRTRRQERRSRLPLIIGLLVLGVLAIAVVLGVLAMPFRAAPGEASAAKTELEAAKLALSEGDMATATLHIQSARRHADAVQASVQGTGGDVWSKVPVAGGAVDDVRNLGAALDELVGVAEVGIEAWPQISGDKATLYDNGNVDLPTLRNMTDDLRDATARLEQAQSHLRAVPDERFLFGSRMGDVRDEALDEVDPLVSGVHDLDPVLDVLPQILGSTADRKYILALLNPSEMLYSGGTPQSYFTLSLSKGKLSISDTLDGHTAPWIAEDRWWKKVPGNPFHRGKLKMATSTMAPDWSVSGHELANSWRAIRGRRMSGVIVVDVVALSRLVALTGPVELPGRGTLTSDNLVHELIGNYDAYLDNEMRHDLNQALGNLFADRLLAGSPLDTAQVLGAAANERRFAVFFRNPDEQQAFDDLGLTGRLAPPDRDYLGVFTQNRVASKSDYWQRRAVTSTVRVKEDGSARVRVRVEVHNDSPPYAMGGEDPKTGYHTRWNHLSVMAMLPAGAEVRERRVDGDVVVRRQGGFYDHVYTRQIIDFAPQARHSFEIEYDVPKVADVLDDGALAYGLALDPQGMVNPQAVTVKVHFPKGFDVTDLPEGWTSKKTGVAVFTTDGLIESESFAVTAKP